MARPAQQTYQERIIQDPEILVGKPVIRGTRIPVDLVLKRLAQDLDLDTLFESYPRLTIEDVQACLEYARTLVQQQPKASHKRHVTAPTASA